ncbi:MAG: NAD(P)H-dependent oxidoreductase [Candidatus Njordarchaeia archaeon]
MADETKVLKRFITWLNGYAFLFNSDLYGDLKAIIQFHIKYGNTTLPGYFEIGDGKARFNVGVHDSPSITIRIDSNSFISFLRGDTTPQKLWLQKKVKIEGEVEYFFSFNEIFSKKLLYVELDENNQIRFDVTRIEVKSWRKPDHVLVLNGSARQKRGFTWEYLKYLVNGMERVGVDVEVIHVYDAKLKINPCFGCFACWTHFPGKCIVKDDATWILEKFKESYLTIFATPLYLYSVPAKFKALLDRTFIELQPVLYPDKNYTKHPLWHVKERYLALFAISGYPEMEVFNSLREMIRGLARDASIPLIAEIFRPNAWILKTLAQYRDKYRKVVEALDAAGEQLVLRGNVDSEILAIISKRYIPKEDYYTYNNLFWMSRYLKMKK